MTITNRLIKYRKPHTPESPRIEPGFHACDEVIGYSSSGDVLTNSHGSIHPNTMIKKDGTVKDLLKD